MYRDDRDRAYAAPARSPPPRFRERSPLPVKRGRELSPEGSRGRRSPPPKRERVDSLPRPRYDERVSRELSPPRRRYSPDPRDRQPSPRGAPRDYSQRSGSPIGRGERSDGYRRPRSPSMQGYPKNDYLSAEGNGGSHSVSTSRRSSPPVHPSRLQQVDDRLNKPIPRDPYDVQDEYQTRSPGRQAASASTFRGYSEDQGYSSADTRIPPPREPYRPDDQPVTRALPTGPSDYRAPSASMAPPTGPAAASAPSSAQARASPVIPSGPRAVSGPVRGEFGTPRGRGGYRGDFSGRGGYASSSLRGGRGGAFTGPAYDRDQSIATSATFGRGESYDRESEYPAPSGHTGSSAPPSGPRGSVSQAAAPAFRPSNNSSATTYPRSQRFAANGQPIPESSTPTGPRAGRRPTEPGVERERGPHPAIADLSKPIAGGSKAEPIIDRTKLDKLEAEAEKLRRIIDEKESKKRKSLREWDRLSRETEAAAFRSQIAEEALRNASGEAASAGAF